jgi:glutamate/tyrosine decarboxylase-like PLP-dependent enzyme
MTKLDPNFRKALDTAYEEAITYLESLDHTSVAATADVHQLRAQLAKQLADEGIDPQLAVAELARDVNGGLLGSAGGRFFGWVIGGVLPAALAADWLTSAWQQNAALYACSPAAAVVEEIVGGWLKEILGLPSSTSFAIVTGCQMAHVTCLAAARHSVLDRIGWDVERQGLFNAPVIRILTSTERHGSFERAVRLIGLGSGQIKLLPADSEGRLIPEALQDELAADPDSPTIVLLQAGDINIGAYDNFEQIIPIARKHGAWVHVDGAFGLWAGANDKTRHLVKSIDGADSWATDGHKWLNVPFDCGFAFVRDTDAHRASMASHASYITHVTNARDQMDWNPEWSRRSRAFSVYAALRQLGRNGVANLVDRCCQHARSIVVGIGKLPGAEMLWEPEINQGLVRFIDPRPGAADDDHDRYTEAVIAKILLTGEAFFGATTWRGRRAMRVSVCNWQTSEADVERVIRAVREVLESGE